MHEMYHMKTATVRDLRYSFSRIARWIRAGESVEVTYRKKRFALLIPEVRATPKASRRPDFEARLKRLFPNGIKGKPVRNFISHQVLPLQNSCCVQSASGDRAPKDIPANFATAASLVV